MGKTVKGIYSLVLSCACFMLIFSITGCMSVRGTEALNDAPLSKDQFSKKSVAVLPVKAQSSLSTDSLLSLRAALNEKIDDRIKERLPNSKIVDTKSAVNTLNDKGKLGLLDDLIKTYDSTGIFDKRAVDSLCATLNSDYVVFSRLKAEKMAVAIMGKGFGASLEVDIIGRDGKDIVWAGAGEFKRGGILGFGTTDNKKAAEELVDLAFQNF
jgi:hypothetical protein